MMTTGRYHICHDVLLDGLEEQVNKCMEMGFKPHGQIIIESVPDDYVKDLRMYHQAMVSYEPEHVFEARIEEFDKSREDKS